MGANGTLFLMMCNVEDWSNVFMRATVHNILLLLPLVLLETLSDEKSMHSDMMSFTRCERPRKHKFYRNKLE